MKVLVTGASGAIGTALCGTLLARGDQVAGLTRDPAAARRSSSRIEWHAWEPRRERPGPEAFEGVDAVVNLVGAPINQRWSDEAKKSIMESRRTGTRNLVAAIAALEKRPKALISGSAVGYYGDRGETEIDESAGPGTGFASEAVVEWEAAALEIEAAGLRLAIVRTGLVLDPESGLLDQLLTPFKLGVGGPVGGGAQYMPWIHLADEVGILVWALDNENVTGAVNATSPNPATNKEFSKALGRALSRPALVPVPGIALNLILGSELAETVKGGQRAIPKRTLELGYSFRHPELDEALRDLLKD